MNVENIDQWMPLAIQLLLLLLVALLAFALVSRISIRLLAARPVALAVLYRIRSPLRYVLLLACAQAMLRVADDALPGMPTMRYLVSVLLILGLTVAGVRGVSSLTDAIIRQNPADMPDNLRARSVHTQVTVLSRVVIFTIVLIGGASALMTLPSLRSLGASMLASAGIAGLAAGFAAKPVLGNLLAGLQIAFTQPIRLDDVVIMQGEWGKIEEITSAYVVVRLWDERRLIVPLQWLIENPFQNWTRSTSALLGSAFLWVDYAMPLEPIRTEARRICEGRREWDGKLCLVQVTDATETAIQLRFLVSARDAADAFDLRCELREGIVAYMARHYPQHLPQRRVELRDGAAGAGA